MSLLFMDGFDYLGPVDGVAALDEKWTTAVSPTGTAYLRWKSSEGRFGAGAAKISAGTGAAELEKVFPSKDTVIVGFAFKPGGYEGRCFAFRLDGKDQAWCEIEADLTVTWYYMDSGASRTVIAETSATGKAFSNQQWHHVEIKIHAGDGDGTLEMRVNEEEWINVTGVTTVSPDHFDLTQSSNVKYGSYQFEEGIGGVYWLDDAYIMDTAGTRLNDFIGDCRIEPLQPTADGALEQFTPKSGGDNYVEVDDPERDEDSSYNESDVVGDKDLFVMQDLATTPETIFAVQATINARKTEAGTRGLVASVRIGGTDYDSSEHLLLQDYIYEMFIWETSPDSGAAWTESEVNNMEAGYAVGSST